MRWIALFCFFLSVPAFADLAPLEVTEEDASPSTFPYQVKFANGTVTDNGDGTVSISAGSSNPSGAVPTLTFTDTTVGENDFEWYADGGSFYGSDTTSGNVFFRYQSQKSMVFLPQGTLIIGDDGTTGVTLSGSSGNLTVTPPGGTVSLANAAVLVPPAKFYDGTVATRTLTFDMSGSTNDVVMNFASGGAKLGITQAGGGDTAFGVGLATPLAALHTIVANNLDSMFMEYYRATTDAGRWTFIKGRGTFANPTAALAGDELCNLYFSSYQNTRWAAIRAFLESGTARGYFTFETTPSSVGSLTERMRISGLGYVSIGVAATAGGMLEIDSTGTTTKTLILKEIASQTANVLEVQNSSAAVLDIIYPDGAIELGAGTTTPGKFRLALKGGTSVATTDWALANWGANATVSAVTGNDSRGTVTVATSALDTPLATPTLTLTFKDGTWTSAPFSSVCMSDTSTGNLAAAASSSTATTLRITYVGTPTALTAANYVFNYMVEG